MRKILIIMMMTLLGLSLVKAQSVIEVEPLFEYPTPPEELENLTDRCDFLVKNFWNNFNFKTKEAIDQYALTGTFQVYTSALVHASKKEAEQSVDKLVEKLNGNPGLMIQFCKAAEECLYGPRAEYWADGLYLKFLDGAIKNKKISASRKEKFTKQASSLRESEEGQRAPSFDFYDSKGDKKNYFPMSTPTILIIGNPNNTDWRMARLKMESNFQLSDALEKGKVNILYIVPSNTANWKSDVANYNKRWTVGQSDEISLHYDTRLDPSLYLVGTDGKILSKNIPFETAVKTVLESVN